MLWVSSSLYKRLLTLLKALFQFPLTNFSRPQPEKLCWRFPTPRVDSNPKRRLEILRSKELRLQLNQTSRLFFIRRAQVRQCPLCALINLSSLWTEWKSWLISDSRTVVKLRALSTATSQFETISQFSRKRRLFRTKVQELSQATTSLSVQCSMRWVHSRAYGTQNSLVKCSTRCSCPRYRHTVKRRRNVPLEDRLKTLDRSKAAQAQVKEQPPNSVTKQNKGSFNKNNSNSYRQAINEKAIESVFEFFWLNLFFILEQKLPI